MKAKELRKEREDNLKIMYEWFSEKIDERIKSHNYGLPPYKVVIDFDDINLYYYAYNGSITVPLEMFQRKVDELKTDGFEVTQKRFLKKPLNK